MSRKHHMFRVGFVVAVVVLLLTACTGVTEPAPTPAPLPEQTTEAVEEQAQASALLDTTWTVRSFGGPEEPIPSVEGTYPSVNFQLARFSGYTGCNYFVGPYYVDGNSLTVEPPAVTQGFCEDDLLQQQEDAFLTILFTVDRYELDGENLLNLYAQDRLLMTLEPLEPVPFEGTTWNYRFIQTNMPGWQPLIPGTSITAKFEGDTISGSAGCNDYTATFTRDDFMMTIELGAVTLKECPEPEGIMEQEQRYLEALRNTDAIRQFARSFELLNAEQPLMLFNAD